MTKKLMTLIAITVLLTSPAAMAANTIAANNVNSSIEVSFSGYETDSDEGCPISFE